MGRDKKGPVTGLKRDFHQVSRVQAQDRPAVRGDITDSIQSLIQFDNR